MATVFAVNEVVARVIAGEMEHHFEGRDVVLPPFLRFGEFNAIKFWMYFISGLDVDSAQRFGRLVDGAIDKRLFNDHQAGKELRREEYQKLLRSFAGFISGPDCSTDPLPLMVLLPDHERSLGSSLEKALALRLGIAVKEAVFDSKHPRFQDDILRRLIQPHIEENELFWGTIKGYRFSTPTIEGDGKNLVVLRDFQG